MPTDVRSIKASINLDTVGFNKGMTEAHTHAHTEGAKIREELEAIAEVFSEALGPAAAEFGQELQSAFAGFSEGPAIGALNLLGLAAGQMREAVESAGSRFHEMGLEAQKAGVSVEFLSDLTNVGENVGVSLQNVGLTFKFLQEKAAEASHGGKEAAKDFEAVGLSVDQVSKLMENP